METTERSVAESIRNGQKVPDRKFPFLSGFSTLFCLLHELRHEIAHCSGSLLLHPAGGVGVGAEGKSSVIVTQHSGDSLHVYTIL